MNLCPRVLCSHRPHNIERLFLVVIFLYLSRFGQALSSLFHVYVCIYLVFAVAISSFISSFYYVMLCFTLSFRHVRN